jgi:non-ribosomal peptide synthetase component F
LSRSYDDRVISPVQVERFLRQIAHIVHQLCDPSERLCLADLEIIPLEDVEEMFSWNSAVPAPTQALVHEHFIAQARQQPDAEALVSWEGSLTYRQLDEMSGRLASRLWTAWGLRSGIRVPLLFEKSLWTVVAMFAVLKIGAANVALNPAHPPDRWRSLIEDVDANFILCSQMHQSLAGDIAPRSFCVRPATAVDGL